MKVLPVQNQTKMHVFSTTRFCYVQNKTKLDPHCEKASLSAMIKSSLLDLFSGNKGY